MKSQQNLNVQIKTDVKGLHNLIVEFNNVLQAYSVCTATFQIISFVKSTMEIPSVQFKKQLEHILRNLLAFLPGDLVNDGHDAANDRKLPFYATGNKPLEYSYGQGSKAVLFNHASSENDSVHGCNIQNNKMNTGNFLRKLGYPTTEQKIVNSLDECRKVIKKFGFPAVIKPRSEKQGNGVTVNICRTEQVEKAYVKASQYDNGKVLIEKFIEGDIYRITISQEKLNTIYLMIPARVIGDGEHDITYLVEKNNQWRADKREKGVFYKNIIIDEDAHSELMNASLNIHSVPEKGQKVYLRRNSNHSTGGSDERIKDEDLHPEVLEMLIDICRAFRLDNVGFDYITTDITKSWREDGTIIEVNAYPSIERILWEQIFDNYFPDNDYRINTCLLVTENKNFNQKIYNAELKKKKNIGFVSSTSTIFKGGEMAIPGNDLYKRCLALILNPSCDGLVISMTPAEIIENGLPIDYVDQCLIDVKCKIDNNLEKWLENYVGTILNNHE
ncbi:MAG: ATP-grasp domain-containing protein [Emcibacteraceae bacterium]|nr:ATP-grasp domain-containing protein [Emcibacteraceae bacterium]